MGNAYNTHQYGRIKKESCTTKHPQTPYTVTTNKILSRCGWSPFESHTFPCSIDLTLVGGVVAYENGVINEACRGSLLSFEH